VVLDMPKQKYKKKKISTPKEEILLKVRVRTVLCWKQTKKNTTQRKIKTRYCWQIPSLKRYHVYAITTTHLQLTTIKTETWTIQSIKDLVDTHQYSRVHQVYHFPDNLSNRFNNITIHSSIPISTMFISNRIDTKRCVW
jgi:hypothetical protein